MKIKKKENVEQCGDVFDSNRCTKPAGHHGKHLDDRDGWNAWTDAGKARILSERAANQNLNQ